MAAEERDVSVVALVAGGGIGFEVVRQLAQQGMTVILGARDLDKVSAAAEELSSVAWAATLPDHGPSGGFFRDGEPMPW